MAETSNEQRIVVGVDFGTTFSGWPGGNNLTSDKVPSEIAYIQPKSIQGVAAEAEADGWSFLTDALDEKLSFAPRGPQETATSTENTIQWGCQVRPEQPRLRYVKLLLDPTQDMPDFVSTSEMREQLAIAGKDATAIVADYLREVYTHASSELAKRYGKLFLKTTKLEWVLTVPAVWSDAAKDATLTAAKLAGMGPELMMISEPEAAAVYTLQAIQPNYLKVGDNFVVVDAGGGTVDLISYIKQNRPLRIEESVPGSGACCGAALLNIKFEEYVKSRLGDKAFDRLLRTKPKSWQTAMRNFEEYVKRNFDPDDMEEFNIPFPGADDNEDAGLEQGFLTLPGAVVGKMFGSTVVKILKLVDGQVKQLLDQRKTLAGVVLVGGFGQSRFLFKALTRHFTTPSAIQTHGGEVEILQPANAWTAVVRGAVLRGLEGAEMVTSRKARRHYGVAGSNLFDSAVHPKSCKFWDEMDGEWRARNRMKWFITKGCTVSSTDPILAPYACDFTDGRKTMTVELIVCDDVAPPGYDSRPIASTRILCRMPVNLETVPTQLWKQRVSPSGLPYQSLHYEVGMQMESGGLKFDMRVDDVVYGSITATFD